MSDDRRPKTAKEKEQFSSRGNRSLLILRGQWGLSVDKAIVWTTGFSLVTAQYAWATDPHWVHNVRAHPDAWVRVQRRNRRVRAHVAQGAERDRVYADLCRQSRSTELYQNMCAPRELPLVVLRG